MTHSVRQLKRSLASAFTSMELLMAMAVGAVAISAATVAFGTFVRTQPKVGSSVSVNLGTARMGAYYGRPTQATVQAHTAPNYGALAKAERLRELFLADTMRGTAVYCLYRTTPNTYHPTVIPFDPVVDAANQQTGSLDTILSFRQHLINKSALTGVTAANFTAARNHTAYPVPFARDITTYNYGCSIFILGHSRFSQQLVVIAIYDVDVDKMSAPDGFYASVKRWAGEAGQPAVFTSSYEVFYPPSNTTTWPTTNDAFAPLFVAFERDNKRVQVESVAIDRFKVAKEHPFYFVWWPDPANRSLDTSLTSGSIPPSTSPSNVYYHLAGRTAFMFTIPMFPTLL